MSTRNRFVVAFLILVLLPYAAYAQTWRGMGRIQGVVEDTEGKPIEGARVVLVAVSSGEGPKPVMTDARGRWAALGLAGGAWNIDIDKEGYLPKSGRAQLSETQRIPPIETVMEPVPPPKEPEPVVEQIMLGGEVISKEIAAWIEEGNRLLGEKKFAEAIVEYEKAQTALPTNLPLKQAMARAYYGAGQLAPAVALLRDVHKANPADHASAVLLANVLIENDELKDAELILKGLPEGSIQDPMTFVNVGILFMNKNRSVEAIAWLDRAVAVDEKRGEPYYYRGLAYLQSGKSAQAKADLQKFIDLAPDASEVREARELLAQIK